MPESEDDRAVAIIDQGTGVFKTGLSNFGVPSAVFGTCVGRPWAQNMMGSTKDYFVGSQAQLYRGLSVLEWPMEHGIIQDWDTMEQLWMHTFETELRVAVGAQEEYEEDVKGVFITEPALNPHKQREKLAEYMFEKFQTRRLHIGVQGTLALYSSGRESGMVLSCGDGVTVAMPIQHGLMTPHAVQRSQFGGRDVSTWLSRLLNQSGVALESSAEQMIVQQMKHELCYLSMDYSKEVAAFSSKPYTMPDHSTVEVNEEVIVCPELLFQPMICGRETPGLHQLVANAIGECSPEVRGELLGNLLLSGGTALFKNMARRLKVELEGLLAGREDTPQEVKVVEPMHLSDELVMDDGSVAPSCTTDVFDGACIVTNLSTFSGDGSSWMHRFSNHGVDPAVAGWDEVGARCVPLWNDQ